MIYRFQPFATDKSKFGETYNAHVAMVPNSEDWIQITDWDVMPLMTEQYHIIDRAIEKYPDTVIFGAMCNRVGHSFQRLKPEPDSNDKITDHIRIAEERAKRYADGECQDIHTVAGFFMLFRKSYWKEVGGFHPTIIKETNPGRGNLFDFEFCLPAHKSGRPIRIIKGLYLWHTYRLTHENYKRKDHLKL